MQFSLVPERFARFARVYIQHMLFGFTVIPIDRVFGANVLGQYYEAFHAPIIKNSFTNDATSPDKLKVVSWNIEYCRRNEAVRREMMSNPLIKQADVLLLQEVQNEGDLAFVDWLADVLHMNYAYAPAIVFRRKDHTVLTGQATLTKAKIEKTDIIFHTGLIDLTKYWGEAGGDITLRSTITHAGKSVSLYNVHLEAVSRPSGRVIQANEVNEFIAAHETPDQPIIMAGDFNTFYDRKTIPAFTKAGFSEFPHGLFHKTTNGPGYLVLDHVLVKGKARLDSTTPVAHVASDHRIMAADVTLV